MAWPDGLTFDDGVLWAATRLVEFYDQPTMAAELLEQAGVDISRATEPMSELATLIEENDRCRILLWPATKHSDAQYAVYDLARSSVHFTRSPKQARRVFRRWSNRPATDDN